MLCCAWHLFFRGAGPVGRINGHTQPLLDMLTQSGIADSQDSHIKAAATAVLQQLLAPGVIQWLLSCEAHRVQAAPSCRAARAAACDRGTAGSVALCDGSVCERTPPPQRQQQQQQEGPRQEQGVLQLQQQDQQHSGRQDVASQLVGAMVHLLLLLEDSTLPAWDQQPVIAAESNTAAGSNQGLQVEQLLCSLASAAGFDNADELLGSCRTEVLEKVSH